MDFLPFYIYWVLGGDLSTHFPSCGSNSDIGKGICISDWSCIRIAKGINIGFCEMDESENICCKIPALYLSNKMKQSPVLHGNKYDENTANETKNVSSVLQTKNSSVGSDTFLALQEQNSSSRSWNIFAPLRDYRNPVKIEVNQNMRSPVKVEVDHNMRITVKVEEKQNMRSPVKVEENQNMRSSVEVEINQNMRISAKVEANQNMRVPVEQHKNFNLRRPVLPNESHDLRWPVLDEYNLDLRKPFPEHNTKTHATKVVNIEKIDKPKEDVTSDTNLDFTRFYNLSLDKISGENYDYVRCVDHLSSTLNNISNQYIQMETTDEKLYRERLAASSEVCGKSHATATAKLVGGKESKYLQWPWMVSLGQHYRNKIRHKCGATLLNNLWVITAAHCVDLVPKENFVLHLGDNKLKNDGESHDYVVRFVKRIIKHQKFDPTSYENDIALLLMNSPVEFRPNIIPICLPKKIGEIDGLISVVLGWGRVKEDGYLSGSLQELNLPVLSNRECEEMYSKVGPKEDIKDIFICAGNAEGGMDTCDGDSGGPMLIPDSEDRWALIGVVSWGKVCGAPYQPGVYTRITEYLDWIDGILACHITKKEYE